MAFKTPPLGISNDPLWWGYGYFLELHNGNTEGVKGGGGVNYFKAKVLKGKYETELEFLFRLLIFFELISSQVETWQAICQSRPTKLELNLDSKAKSTVHTCTHFKEPFHY